MSFFRDNEEVIQQFSNQPLNLKIWNFQLQVSRRSVPIEVSGSPLPRRRLMAQAQGDTASSISSLATLPGSPLRSSTSVLASLDKSILQIRWESDHKPQSRLISSLFTCNYCFYLSERRLLCSFLRWSCIEAMLSSIGPWNICKLLSTRDMFPYFHYLCWLQ